MALPPARPFDPSLRQRVVSSLVLGAGALAATIAGGWAFVAMVVVAIVIMAGEWSRLATEVPAPRVALVAATAAVPVLAVLALVAVHSPALAAGVLVAGAATLALASPTWRPLRAAGGALYVGTPALALVWLRADTPAGMRQLIWLLAVIWATDICAYLVGRSLGGPKLAPRISPGKTWSGLLGGVAGASLLGGLAAQALGAGHLLAAALGGGLAVVGQAGDLFESALKRRAGLKDSGHLIPGHGGLLDRIDGLVFAAPVFAGLVWLGLRAEGSP